MAHERRAAVRVVLLGRASTGTKMQKLRPSTERATRFSWLATENELASAAPTSRPAARPGKSGSADQRRECRRPVARYQRRVGQLGLPLAMRGHLQGVVSYPVLFVN